jgi:hypothetical protein
MLDEKLLIITERGAMMSSKKFQKLQVYRLAEQLTDEIWKIVNNWDSIVSLNHSCKFLAPLSRSGRGVGGEGYFTIHLDWLYSKRYSRQADYPCGR